MHGVVSTPATGVSLNLGLVILNSGLLHHVGSCCFSVKVGRAATEMGMLSLRYDASGIGDSSPRNSALPIDERSVQELQEVLDFLELKYGITRFVVMGLCSGAFAAFSGALVDSRIVGIVQIAGFAYRTVGWYIRHYGARITQLQSWKNVLSRIIGREINWRTSLDRTFLEPVDDGWEIPAQNEVASGYKKLIENKIRILNIMTAGEAYDYNYPGQFADMFPILRSYDQFSELHFAEANHIITQPVAQEAVTQAILHWLSVNFVTES